MSVILGVDPGLTRCGFGVLNNNQSVDFGVFTSLPSSAPSDRVGSIAAELEDLVIQHKPGLIALERVFAQCGKQQSTADHGQHHRKQGGGISPEPRRRRALF